MNGCQLSINPLWTNSKNQQDKLWQKKRKRYSKTLHRAVKRSLEKNCTVIWNDCHDISVGKKKYWETEFCSNCPRRDSITYETLASSPSSCTYTTMSLLPLKQKPLPKVLPNFMHKEPILLKLLEFSQSDKLHAFSNSHIWRNKNAKGMHHIAARSNTHPSNWLALISLVREWNTWRNSRVSSCCSISHPKLNQMGLR